MTRYAVSHAYIFRHVGKKRNIVYNWYFQFFITRRLFMPQQLITERKCGVGACGLGGVTIWKRFGLFINTRLSPFMKQSFNPRFEPNIEIFQLDYSRDICGSLKCSSQADVQNVQHCDIKLY